MGLSMTRYCLCCEHLSGAVSCLCVTSMLVPCICGDCSAPAVSSQSWRYLSAVVQQLTLCRLAAAEENHGWLVKSEEGSPSQEPPPSQQTSKTALPKRAQPSALSPDKQQQSKQGQPDQEEEEQDEDRPLLFALNSFRRRRDSLNIRYSTSTYYDGQLYTPA